MIFLKNENNSIKNTLKITVVKNSKTFEWFSLKKIWPLIFTTKGGGKINFKNKRKIN